MKIEVWCDSGANIHSCRKEIIDTEEFGLTDDEWTELPEEIKEEYVKDVALSRLNWGWEEL